MVGRKLLYNKKESEKLMDRLEKPRMTQVKLAREEDENILVETPFKLNVFRPHILVISLNQADRKMANL